MKKLFVFLSVLSVVNCFAAVPKGIEPANAPIHWFRYPQAFNLIREAITQKAWESETGEVSAEEIEDILAKEELVQHKEFLSAHFKDIAQFWLGGLCTATTSLGLIGWLLLSRKVSSLKPVVKGGLIAGCGMFIAVNILVGFARVILYSPWKLKNYTRILDSRFVQMDSFPGRYYGCFLSLLVTNYDNLSDSEKEWVKHFQHRLQEVYPKQYPDVYSLKIDFEKIRAEKAIQALFGDVTHADGTERKRKVVFAATVDALLSKK